MNGASTPIVITGLGTLSAAGVGLDALRRSLEHGQPQLSAVDRSHGYHVPPSARNAALVGTLDTRQWIEPLIARRMSAPSRFAVVAARLALHDAELPLPASRDPATAVALATTYGPLSFTQGLLDQILTDGPGAASPSLFTECVANAPSAQIAIHCRASGPNHTLCQREAGVLTAVERGARELLRGRARLALAGAVEEMTPILHGLLDRFRALARPKVDEPEAARPFDRRRDGFIAAEGATVLALEAENDAIARKARIRARILSFAQAFDASARRAGWGTGAETLSHALERALDRAGIDASDIDAIVSGASGSRAGDRLEAAVLNRAWRGRKLPPVLAPKAVTGEYGGAFVAAALLAASGVEWPAPAAAIEVDPELGIRLDEGGLPARPRRVLVTSLASGGSASWLVLEGV